MAPSPFQIATGRINKTGDGWLVCAGHFLLGAAGCWTDGYNQRIFKSEKDAAQTLVVSQKRAGVYARPENTCACVCFVERKHPSEETHCVLPGSPEDSQYVWLYAKNCLYCQAGVPSIEKVGKVISDYIGGLIGLLPAEKPEVVSVKPAKEKDRFVITFSVPRWMINAVPSIKAGGSDK
jgi:hypothetical protein